MKKRTKIKNEWYNGDRTHDIMALLDADANEFETMGTGDEMMDRIREAVYPDKEENEDEE